MCYKYKMNSEHSVRISHLIMKLLVALLGEYELCLWMLFPLYAMVLDLFFQNIALFSSLRPYHFILLTNLLGALLTGIKSVLFCFVSGLTFITFLDLIKLTFQQYLPLPLPQMQLLFCQTIIICYAVLSTCDSLQNLPILKDSDNTKWWLQ